MWDWVPDWAKQEVAELKRAPTGVVILFLLGSSAGWWAASAFYAERIAVYEARLEAPAPVVAMSPSIPERPQTAFVLIGSKFVNVGNRPVDVRPFRFEFEFANTTSRTLVRIAHKVVMVDYKFANRPKVYPSEPAAILVGPNTGFAVKVPTLIQGHGEKHYVVIGLRFSDERTPERREDAGPYFLKWAGMSKGKDGADYLTTELDSTTESERAEILSHLHRDFLFPPN